MKRIKTTGIGVGADVNRRTKPEPVPPTLEQFSKYQKAWQWFNAELFGGTLKPCLLNFSRHRGSYGFFTPQRWRRGKEEVHEISLNPDSLSRELEEVMSTLVHEMVHQWQQDHGTPPRRCYHDTEWAEKMVEVGLVPSDTGEPGGRPTGQNMTHFIDPKGRFRAALDRMPKECVLPWVSEGPNEKDKPKKPRPKKVKFTCPECRTKITADDEGLDANCNDCGERFLNPDELKEELENRRDN